MREKTGWMMGHDFNLLEYTRSRNVSIVMEDLTPLLKDMVRHMWPIEVVDNGVA